MNIHELLVSTLMPVIKSVGKAQLKDIFAKWKEHNGPEVYVPALKGIHAGFKLLHEVALKTATKIDDGIVDTVTEAIEEFAAAEGIEL